MKRYPSLWSCLAFTPLVLLLAACGSPSVRGLVVRIDFSRQLSERAILTAASTFNPVAGSINVPITGGGGAVNKYSFGPTGSVLVPRDIAQLHAVVELDEFTDNAGYDYKPHDSKNCDLSAGCVFDGTSKAGTTSVTISVGALSFTPPNAHIGFVVSAPAVDPISGPIVTDTTLPSTFTVVAASPVAIVSAALSVEGEVVFRFGCPGQLDLSVDKAGVNGDLCKDASGADYSVSQAHVRVYENPPAAVKSALAAQSAPSLAGLTPVFDNYLGNLSTLVPEIDPMATTKYTDLAAYLAYPIADYMSGAAKSWLITIDNQSLIDDMSGAPVSPQPGLAYRYELVTFP